MNTTITKRFLDSVSALAAKPLDEKIKQQVRYCLIDYTACTMLGASLLREENLKYLASFGDPGDRVPVVGLHRKAGVLTAAMLNGINSHMIELDDGHRFAMLHLGAPVISAMLAVACDRGMDAEHFMKGIVTGYEATVRLAAAIQPGHKLRGYHATATCGTIGTALGIAEALDLPEDCRNAVITAAATDAAGLLQVIDDGSELKPYNVGRAASAAVNAVYSASMGLAGPTDVLGGGRGFFKTMADRVDEDLLLQGFLPDYAIERIYRKPYAACRHCHSAIEAALLLRQELQEDTALAPDEISSIDIDTYGLAVRGHDHKEVKGAGSAKMSIPYGVACALLFGKVNYQQYERACLEDAGVAELMKKVSVREDPALSALVPGKRVAEVTVRTGDQTYRRSVDYPLGEPENPMSREMLEEKYDSLMAAAGVSQERRRTILTAIYDIEHRFEELPGLL